MSKQIINNVPGVFPPLPVYSQVVISNGTVYVSGSIGCDNEHNITGGVLQQTIVALQNMKALLEAAGSGLEHVVKVTVYLSNLPRDFDIFNDVYAKFFEDVGAMPARTCIGVSALPLGAFVEVDCIAELPRALSVDEAV